MSSPFNGKASFFSSNIFIGIQNRVISSRQRQAQWDLSTCCQDLSRLLFINDVRRLEFSFKWIFHGIIYSFHSSEYFTRNEMQCRICRKHDKNKSDWKRVVTVFSKLFNWKEYHQTRSECRWKVRWSYIYPLMKFIVQGETFSMKSSNLKKKYLLIILASVCFEIMLIEKIMPVIILKKG